MALDRRIKTVTCTDEREEHFAHRGIDLGDIHAVCTGEIVIARARDGCHVVLGLDDNGRYLAIVVVLEMKGRARVITAREMDKKECRRYRAIKRNV